MHCLEKKNLNLEPTVPGFVKVFSPLALRDKYSSWDECNRFAANMLEDVILNEGPETIAAFVIAPMGNTGGLSAPTDEYFKIIREICTKYNILLIFDEKITALAKTGAMFASQTYGVVPDIICAGKSLSSGIIALGAMCVSSEIGEKYFQTLDRETQFSHGQSYVGHPLGCAVGIEAINEIQEKKLDSNAEIIGNKIKEKLEQFKKYGVVREVRGRGVLVGAELVRDTKTNEPFPELGKAFKETTIKNGVILRIENKPTWFSVSPPLIATNDDIEELMSLVEKSLRDALDLVTPGKSQVFVSTSKPRKKN